MVQLSQRQFLKEVESVACHDKLKRIGHKKHDEQNARRAESRN